MKNGCVVKALKVLFHRRARFNSKSADVARTTPYVISTDLMKAAFCTCQSTRFFRVSGSRTILCCGNTFTSVAVLTDLQPSVWDDWIVSPSLILFIRFIRMLDPRLLQFFFLKARAVLRAANSNTLVWLECYFISGMQAWLCSSHKFARKKAPVLLQLLQWFINRSSAALPHYERSWSSI